MTRLAHARASSRASAVSPPRASASSSPGATTSFVGEDDVDAARGRRLGDDVDRRRLQLDEEDVGVGALEVSPERARGRRGSATRGRRRPSRWSSGSRAGREDGDAPSRERLQRARAEARRERRRPSAPRRPASSPSSGRRVADQHPVRVQVPGVEVVRRRGSARPPRPAGSRRRCRRRRRGRARSPAASRAPSSTFEVNGRAGEPAAAAAAADVGTPASAAVSRWSDAAWRPARERSSRSSTVGARLHHLRLGRPAAAHRDDDDVAVAARSRATCPVTPSCRRACRCRSPRATGTANGSNARRLEAEVGADVRQPGREHAAREREAARAGRAPARRRGRRRGPAEREPLVERRPQRHAVVLAAAELLRPADEHGADEVVRQARRARRGRRRVVLPVDQRPTRAQPAT